jgi:hypothetical protein
MAGLEPAIQSRKRRRFIALGGRVTPFGLPGHGEL